MFCDVHDEGVVNNRKVEDTYEDVNGNTIFEIEMTYFFNIDYEDEEEGYINEENGGLVELINGENITMETAKKRWFRRNRNRGYYITGQNVSKYSKKSLHRRGNKKIQVVPNTFVILSSLKI